MKFIAKIFLWFCFIGLTKVCWASRIDIPIDTVIKRSPIIIEGKVISVPPAYWADRTIYTSYIIQVYKVFKGNLTTQYIEIPMVGGQVGNESVEIASCGTLSLAGKGQTAIFFLTTPNSLDTNAKKMFFNSGDTIAKHFIIHPYYDALDFNDYKNIERDLYRHIEKLTGQKRKIISRPEVEDPDTRNWLIQNNKQNLFQAVGLSLNISHSELGFEPNTFDLWINSKSSVGYTDLNSLEFAVKYDTKTFGTFVVKNKNVEYNNPNTHHFWKWETIPAILLGDSAYQTKITDLDSSTILISIKATNIKKGVFQIGKELVALLRFNIIDFNSTTNFSFVTDKTKGKYYDYEHSEISSFNYIFCNKGLNISPQSMLAPFVSDFSPDIIQCGETEVLTIKGNNFQSDKTQILIWCTKDDCGFYATIPSTKFLTLTDTTITLNIPCELNIGGSACGSIFPTTSGFIVGKAGLFVDSSSPRKLTIKHSD